MESEESAESSSASETETETQQEDRNVEAVFTARPYQEELLEMGLERNTIVCLGTGTGKTFISVMLIKELSHQIREIYKNGGKRSFFLVNTVPLAIQQATVIKNHTDLNVQHYVGEMGVDFWDKNKWENEFNKNNVLVMTAQIFLNLLLHGFIKLSQVNLLIFDECHHAKKSHPYKQIMDRFVGCQETDHPKIMGLTASVVNKKVKPWKIESEIQELECTLRSTCATSQDEDVEKFASKPNEQIIAFSNADINNSTYILLQKLQVVLRPGVNRVGDCEVQGKGPSSAAHSFALSALKECQEILSELGPWAANKVAGYLIKDLQDRAYMFEDCKEGRMFCGSSASQLQQLQGVYHNYTSTLGSGETGSTEELYIMPKVNELLYSVLKEYGNAQNSENKLCGIVFVERRWTALVLSEQINIAAKSDPEFSFIKSSFVIGHGTGGKANYCYEAEMTFKKQEEVLRQFRLHEFNLLIATSVVEEGLDIPKCNLVCRFDFPMTFRSYVQSKGRARAQDSNYNILVDEEEYEEKQHELKMMQEIEKYLSKKCHGRKEPTKEECEEVADADNFLGPYEPENGQGAIVTMRSSVALLSRYCSTLPRDRFTHLSPIYEIEEDEENGKKTYRCNLQLPNNCQLRRVIYGKAMPRKNLAKMAAALYACIELHKLGELDDNLLPVRCLSDDESESEEEEEESAGKNRGKAGTKKRKRVYERKVPQAFRGSLPQENQPQYLTPITITITKRTNQQGLDVSQRYYKDGVCHLFGLLTNVPVQAVRSFKLYPDYGEVTVTIKCLKSPLRARMTRQDLKTVQKFHCFLFSQVLREPVELIRSTGSDGGRDGYFVVLTKGNGCDVDYGTMHHALTRQTSLERSMGESTKIVEDMLVSKNYTESGQKFAVLGVRHDLSPMSPFPDNSKAKTYEGYFWGKYGKSFSTMNQPLIEVNDISLKVNFLVERKVAAKSKSDVIALFPELCNVLPISASLLSVSLMLPSILHRVNALLLVDDVKEMVAGVRDNTDISRLPSIGAGNANDEKSLIRTGKDKSELFSDLKSLFSGNRGAAVHPDSAFVLQALTTTHSGDAFNLERLEMLGDAFLKLAVSLHLYCNYHDKDEGKLTQRKIRQISNLALFRAAKKTSLAGFQQSTQLARDVWCPTGCQKSTAESVVTAMEVHEVTPSSEPPEKEVDDAGKAEDQGLGSRRDKAKTQEIADKSVADSVEALIGAYLICCGYTGALRFMKFLGLKVLPDNDEADICQLAKNSREGCYAEFWSQQVNNSGANQSQDMVSRMVSGLENFENSIKYTFNSKLYLLEALTHASYQANRVTPCYQRLEFLGDALLDFLVTQHLYFRQENLSPGVLTDIRQALVNNNIFAAIAVKYEYNKYLKQRSPELFKSIENFITKLEDEKDVKDENTDLGIADPFIIVSEQGEEGIKAPKVLGDIFESVAGAVFLDSGMDLTTVWGVYFRMMQPYIDQYSENIPINPIRRVCEEDNERKFSKAEVLADGRVRCTLKVRWGKFVGHGKNSKIAKATAAKRAVQALDKNKSRK